jgi:hypothetical protein
MTPPQAWTILNEELLGLSPVHSTLFWNALTRARWQRPVSLRQALHLVGHIAMDHYALARSITPARVVSVLQALVGEGVLHQSQAAEMLNVILTGVNAHGGWRGDGWDGRERVGVLPPDVQRFAEIGTR